MVKLTVAENEVVVARGWRGGRDGELISGYKVSVMQDERVLELFCTT